MLAELSRRIVGIMRDGTGRGPTRCRSYWVDDDIVLVILGDSYTPSERTLMRGGRQDTVLAQREALQEVLRDRMVDAVQQLTNRRVVAFMSAVHSEPEVNAELFLLEHE